MLGNFWINEIAAVRFQRRKCPFFVVAHKAAIASHICGEDGGQPSFDPRFGHKGRPLIRCDFEPSL